MSYCKKESMETYTVLSDLTHLNKYIIMCVEGWKCA